MHTDQLLGSAWKDLRGELHGFLIGQVGEPAIADDLLQDVFLKLFRSGDQIQKQSSLRAWLYQVARNTVIDHRRRQHATTELPDDLADSETPAADKVQARLAQCLRPLVDDLPALHAVPLRMADFEGKSQAEAARELGISLTAFKSRLRRGRAKLKEILLDCCHFELSARGQILDHWPHQGCCRVLASAKPG